MQDLLPFRFDLPLMKSRQTERVHGEPLWMIQGVGATDQRDLQKERLLLDGMDFEPYIKSGIINWNHLDGPEFLLGEPTEAKILRRKGEASQFFTKGFLYKHQPKSIALWNHLEALEKSKEPITRGIGWSVQGGVIERSGEDLVKSVVRHMALTHEPINPFTWAKCFNSLVKSLSGGVGIGPGGYPPIGVATSDLRPLTVQNLDATITKLIYDPCKYECFDKSQNNFRNGYHGMLDHLVMCKALPINEAKELVLAVLKLGR